MKLIVRADDVGYTAIHNAGTFKAVEEGILTSLDIMLDVPGTEEALEFAKAHPWLSVGWHSHFWGWPVSDKDKIPSMIGSNGRFVGRKKEEIEAKERILYNEALIELEAQIEYCIRVLGRVPDTGGEIMDETNLTKAMIQVCRKYGIHYDVMTREMPTGKIRPCRSEYQHCNIHIGNGVKQFANALTSDIFGTFKYDPLSYMKQHFTKEMLSSDFVYVTPWHPGYLDELVLSESSMTLCRIKDVEMLCSKEIKQWIIENKIELINYRDAIYGTHEYQNHLKAINSPLWIGNM